MTTVTKKSPTIDIRCPEPLRGLPYWLVWRFEQRPGEVKPRKVPYYAGGGRRKGAQGTEEDRARLVTADVALAAASRRGFAGIGFAVLDGCGFDAVDFDDVVQDQTRFLEVRSMLAGTYAEFSPSGNGVRGFVQHTGEIRNLKSHAKEGHPYTFETFASAGFVTFTGDALPEVGLVAPFDEISPPSTKLLALYRGRVTARGDAYSFGEGETGDAMGYSMDELQAMLAALDPSTGYEAWINAGMALHHETSGSEEGFHLWDDWSSGGDNYVSTEDCLSHWSSFRRSSGRLVTIRSLMKQARQAGATVGSPVASPDDFDVIEDTPEEQQAAAEKASRFAVIPAAEILKRKSPGWLVKDTIPDAELVLVYGASGSGKSFVMVDLAMALARGVPWFGRKVRQCPIVYVCAEGAGGFGKRLKAYALQQGIDLKDVPLWVMETAPNLLKADDLKALIQAIKPLNPAVVIMDTLARMTPGANENAGEDMGLAIDNCSKVTKATGARVFLVHHTGKDESRGARGWSGMRAASDAEFEVVRDKANNKRWLETTKEKDTADEGRIGFKLETVVVDMDEDGDAVTSCVVAPDEAPVLARGRGAKEEKLGIWETAILETFSEMQLGGDVLETELSIVAANKLGERGTVKFCRASARRALKNLVSGKKSRLIVEGGHVFERE